jgi:hypothetical protein
MVCGKPSGNPQAIIDAANAIVNYAHGIDEIFDAVDQSWGFPVDDNGNLTGALAGGRLELNRNSSVRFDAFWTGSAATQASGSLSDYRQQLNIYTDNLRNYAAQLDDYASKLQDAQRCSIQEILVWVFIAVFSVVELVVGLLVGGIIFSALTEFFAAVGVIFTDSVVLVGEIVADVVETSVVLTRIVQVIGEVGESLADVVAALGIGVVETADVEIEGGTAGTDGATVGAETAEGAESALTTSTMLADTFDLADLGPGLSNFGDADGVQVFADLNAILDSNFAATLSQFGGVVAGLLARLPSIALEETATFIYDAIYQSAVWYWEEFMERVILSSDPRSGGFAAQWNGDDEKAEVIALLVGMAAGSLGFALAGTFVEAINKVMLSAGLDVSKWLNRISQSWSLVLKGTKTPTEENIEGTLAKLGTTGEESGDLAETLKNVAIARGDVTDAGELWTTRTLEAAGTDADGAVVGLLSNEQQSILNEYNEMIENAAGSQIKISDLIEEEAPGSGAVIKVKDDAGVVVVKDVFDDLMENTLEYAAILALYSPIRGETFDWKEFVWYVGYAIVESFIHAPLQHGGTAISKKLFGEYFPDTDVEAYAKAHPFLGHVAEDGEKSLSSSAISSLRKLFLDQTMDIGSFSDYLKAIAELGITIPIDDFGNIDFSDLGYAVSPTPAAVP